MKILTLGKRGTEKWTMIQDELTKEQWYSQHVIPNLFQYHIINIIYLIVIMQLNGYYKMQTDLTKMVTLASTLISLTHIKITKYVKT